MKATTPILGLSLWFALSAPAAAQTITLEATPRRLLVGRDDVATLKVRGSAEALRDVRVACTVGTLRGSKRLGPTEIRLEYVPPRAADPSYVLCGAASATSGAHGTLPLELQRRDVLALSSLPPLARVEVKLGGATFGPVRANGSGFAEVPVLVTPGARIAEIHATPPGRPAEVRTQTLNVFAGEQLLFVAPTPQVVADGKTPATLFAFAINARGEPTDSPVLWSSSDGHLTMQRVGPGAYTGTLVPMPHGSPGEAVVTGKTEGGRAGSARIELLPGVRPRVQLSSNVRGLPADGLATAELLISVADEQGRGLAGQQVQVVPSAGTVSSVEERGGGTYVARFTAPAGQGTRAEVLANVAGADPAKLVLALIPPPRLTLEATPKEVRADGRSRISIAITGRDPEGRPLPEGTAVQLFTSLGTVPATVAIAGGRAVAELVAGTRSGIANLEVRAADATTSAQIRLLPGAPAKVTLSPERPAVTCDGKDSVQVQVLVQDAHGNGVEGASLELAEELPTVAGGEPLSRGRFERVAALGNGEFSVRYHAPDRCDRRAIAMAASSGGIQGSTQVALVRGFASKLALTVRAGAGHNLGRLTSGTLELEGDLPISTISPRLRGAASAELTLNPSFAGHATSLAGPPVDFTGSSLVASLHVGARWTLYEDERYFLYTGLGLDSHVVRVAFAFAPAGPLPQVQRGFAAGVHVRLGTGYVMGPGLLVAQLRLSAAPWLIGDSAARGQVPGVALTAGYRLPF